MVTGSRQAHRLWLAAILLGTFLVYLPSLANDYTYDARHYAMGTTPDGVPNYMVTELRPIAEYFRRPMQFGVSGSGRGYRPVTVLSYALMHNLCKPRPSYSQPGPTEAPAWPSHLLDVLLHVLATWLVYLLVVEMSGRGPPAVIAAAVFGLHALRSDVVLSIVGRAEILGLVFGTAGVLLYVRSVGRDKRSVIGQLLAMVSLFLAFCSKESAVAWAVFLPLFVWARHRQRSADEAFPFRETAIRWLWICLLPLAVFLILRQLMLAEHLQQDFIVGYRQNPLYHVADPTKAFATAVMMMGYGLYMVFLPLHLACDYGAHVFDIVGCWDYRFLIAAVVLLGILVGGLWVARRAPLVFLAMAVFLGFAFITSNILILAEANFAERFYYTPAVGLSFLAAFVAASLADRVPPRRRLRNVALLVLAAWLLVSGALCVKRSLDWRDNETLFQTDIKAQPRSVSIRMYLSGFARKAGDRKEWRRQLEAALAIDDQSPGPLNSMGHWYVTAGKPDEAVKHLMRGLQSPYYNWRTDGPWIHSNLADAYLLQGKVEKAKAALEEVLRCDPDRFGALQQLLELAAEREDQARVSELLQRGRERFPADNPLLDMYTGRLAFLRGDHATAAGLLGKSLPFVEHTWDPAADIVPLARGWYAYARSQLVLGRPAECARVVQRFLPDPRLPPRERQMFTRLARDLQRR
jgi:Tfp pilus assembly protein PilF